MTICSGYTARANAGARSRWPTPVLAAIAIQGSEVNDTAPYLQHLEFPASKLDVIAEAEVQGAPQELIESLQRVSSEGFESRAAVETALQDARGAAR